MKDPQVKSINALARGLEVLQLLQSTGALTLHDLHRLSGIPKASLLRILKTLKEKGMIWQRMVDSAYVPSHSLSELASRMDREHELTEIASPILEALSDEVKWPSVLAVPRLGHMEVIETNARRAYFGDIPLGPAGFQVNMLRSASGRAYIAYCEDAVREAILERLRRSDRPGDRLARSPAYVARALQETWAQGFGLRDPDFGGHFESSAPRRCSTSPAPTATPPSPTRSPVMSSAASASPPCRWMPRSRRRSEIPGAPESWRMKLRWRRWTSCAPSSARGSATRSSCCARRCRKTRSMPWSPRPRPAIAMIPGRNLSWIW
ncbi:helix-turn-helix domain-containing protein [Psychromarinibacter sp. C21-152]|uniref:Helix-turn-helix domain-containing protein n=1 Tax=Psychromarinibacter sediminicola TaxID=3033385 RepID=A0AAE3NWZ7_9RHOB|nr:helix-turn-helix domain-containing protein [Psychromarinibacter sediminicola]MDF0602490.1 helix-turn-helix domain-containing protein [Psychromarinibacter sediminicola]